MSISLEKHDGVALIGLDDGKANAINPAWMRQFLEVLDEAEADAGAIVLHGRPGVFSGGFDLKWMVSANMDDIGELLDVAGILFNRVYGSPKPVVAACTGHAIAAGAFLLLACDTRLATRGEFMFGANETINNMKLPVFAVELMKARLDPRRLTEAMVQAKMYGPEEAQQVGWFDQLLAAQEVLPTALATAELLAQLPPEAYANNKLALRQPTIDAIAATKAGY